MTDRGLGELFLVGFPDGIDDEARKILREIRPGGIILYPNNMRDGHDLEISMGILYELMEEEGLSFFITSDHEGGQLETVPGIVPSPGNMALGRTEKGYVALYGDYLGKMLKNFGFNTLFAPVLDILHPTSSPVTGLRAYSDDPEKTAEYGATFIKALQKEGIIATAKHFPGHGKADADSHKVLPVVRDFTEDDPDLIPFKRAVKEGVGMIMTAHIIYEKLDNLPATLSKKILTGLLREKLGYEGVIITDAIEMQALYDNYPIEEMVERFFNAGGDIFLVADGRSNLRRSYRALIDGIEKKKIDRGLLDKALKRVSALKERFVKREYPNLFLTEVARDAISLKIEKGVGERPLFVIPSPLALSPADTTNLDIAKYEKTIGTLFSKPSIIRYDITTGKTDGPIGEADTIISLVIDSFRFEGQKRLQASLSEKAKRVIYIILRDPKDEKLYRDREYIATYSTKPISLYHALKRLKEY